MGLFDNLFKKKNCDICGGEIGLLGNRKLEDGNLCKDCAAKLSPWFDGRRHSTVEEIRKQLELREANKNEVQAFHIKPIRRLAVFLPTPGSFKSSFMESGTLLS